MAVASSGKPSTYDGSITVVRSSGTLTARRPRPYASETFTRKSYRVRGEDEG